MWFLFMLNFNLPIATFLFSKNLHLVRRLIYPLQGWSALSDMRLFVSYVEGSRVNKTVAFYMWAPMRFCITLVHLSHFLFICFKFF